jgi:hypothetical protein
VCHRVHSSCIACLKIELRVLFSRSSIYDSVDPRHHAHQSLSVRIRVQFDSTINCLLNCWCTGSHSVLLLPVWASRSINAASSFLRSHKFRSHASICCTSVIKLCFAAPDFTFIHPTVTRCCLSSPAKFTEVGSFTLRWSIIVVVESWSHCHQVHSCVDS